MTLLAFVDESARHRVGDACVYALAAVLIDPDDADQMREQLQQLRSGKTPVLHWRHERPDRRRTIAATLASLPWAGVVTVCFFDYGANTERARRHCLNRLLQELDTRGVSAVHLESRQERRDRHDRALLTGLRHAGIVSHALAVSWGQSEKEPILWAADCVAGAVTWWFGDEVEYLQLLRNAVEVLDVNQP